jgi:hypothetical protein
LSPAEIYRAGVEAELRSGNGKFASNTIALVKANAVLPRQASQNSNASSKSCWLRLNLSFGRLLYRRASVKIPRTRNCFMLGRTRLVALLLFGSGFCALIYQTTWLREFRLIFGGSTAATAAVVGVFMAGLGFGGIILGRRSETKAQPLAFYAKLELLIAASAACSPALVWAVRHLYVAVGGTATLGMFFGTVVRLLFATLIHSNIPDGGDFTSRSARGGNT